MFIQYVSRKCVRPIVSSLYLLFSGVGCAPDLEIETIIPGMLTVAVTTETPSSDYDPQLWIRRYVKQFSEKNQLTVSWTVVPFNESWLLASKNKVDLVATNVASFPDRAHPGATFSEPFLYERRALRINTEDQNNFETIEDFVGNKIGAVAGMAAIDAFKGDDTTTKLKNAIKAAGPGVKEALSAMLETTIDTVASGASTLIALERGTVRTPRMEMMFEGVGRRSFSYEFTFTPKSQQEAKIIEEII
mgnify:CR=1 FL=1